MTWPDVLVICLWAAVMAFGAVYGWWERDE
jgi:hypothetical protein